MGRQLALLQPQHLGVNWPVFWGMCGRAFADKMAVPANDAPPDPPRPRRPRRVTLDLFQWEAPDELLNPKPLLRPRSMFNRKDLSRKEIAFGKSLANDPVAEIPRSRWRPDCQGHEGPCWQVSCRYHLAIDVNDIGSIKVNHPGWDVTDIELYLGDTCALDVGLRGKATIEEVAKLMNLSEERVRQIEAAGRRKLMREGVELGEESSVWKRRPARRSSKLRVLR